MKRAILLVFAMALVISACGGSSDGEATNGAAPECVTNATALARLTQSEGVRLVDNDGSRGFVGDIAPDFALCDENGNVVQLSEFRGRPVLLIFWASWCPHCLVEMPTIDAILKDMPDNLVVIAVASVDDMETAWSEFQGRGYAFKAAFDVSDTVFDAYRLRGVPMAFFIAPDGIIAGRINGEANFENVKCQRQLIAFAKGEADNIITAYCR